MIKQPNAWSCAAASAAMAFNCKIEKIYELCGHDGSAVINPLPSPACRKGFHIQEIVDCGIALGYKLTPIEAIPVQLNSKYCEYDVFDEKIANARFLDYLDRFSGLLVGKARKHWHTVVWRDNIIYDPNGRIYSYSDCNLDIQTFWMIF